MIHIEDLSKTYRNGKKEALRDVNLNIQEGEFTALLGQNGAGKSTLINVLAGNVVKSSGHVVIAGYDIDHYELETKKIIGIVPQETSLDYFFTVEEVLRLQSGYFGILDNNAYINELLDILSLSDKRKSLVCDLSGGMERRLMIAKALVHRPKVLILDEPTAGVDVEMRHSLYDYLRVLHQKGTTIILTTHYLEEAQRLCERIIVINEGSIIADESKDSLMEKQGKNVIIEVLFSRELNHADILPLTIYNPVIEGSTKLFLEVNKKDLMKAVQLLTEMQADILNMSIEKPRLEDIYLKLINNGGQK